VATHAAYYAAARSGAVDRAHARRWRAVWELERRPNWDRFCIDFSRPEGAQGLCLLGIRSPAAAVVERFFDASQACGLYAPIPSHVTRRRVRTRMVPWKPPQSLTELRVPLRSVDQPSSVVDWRQYEALRSWWRSIPELALRETDGPETF
jgi:hypothetical protein